MIKSIQPGKDTLLRIDNQHSEDCGQPASWDVSNAYVGFFTNKYGEQWVFVGEYGKKNSKGLSTRNKAKVVGGDAGWDRVFEVTAYNPIPDCNMNEQEVAWLKACWAAFRRVDISTVEKAVNAQQSRVFERVREEWNKLTRCQACGGRIAWKAGQAYCRSCGVWA